MLSAFFLRHELPIKTVNWNRFTGKHLTQTDQVCHMVCTHRLHISADERSSKQAHLAPGDYSQALDGAPQGFASASLMVSVD